MRDSDGVADRHFEDAEPVQSRGNIGDLRWRNRSLERTPERRREIPANANSGGLCTAADIRVDDERVADVLVDVPAAEGFRRCRKDGNLGNTGRERAVEAGDIWHECRVARARAPGDAG